MKPPFTTTIEGMSHEGRGIARINGKTTFIDNALPQEVVLAQYTAKHRQFDEAIATEIIESSKQRVIPSCSHSNICGGCQLQHLAHQAQTEHKQTALLEQLWHFGQVRPEQILPLISTEQTLGYRRKARLGVRFVNKKQRLLIGFREANGRYIADIDQCLVLDSRVGLKIQTLNEVITHLSIAKEVPQIEVAAGDDEVALIIRHLADFTAEDLQLLQTFAKENQFQLYLQPNKPKSIHKIWPQDEKLYLSYRYQTNYQDRKILAHLRFHPSDFTQVNANINQLMIEQALNLLMPNPQDNILELFCGLGNFSMAIAQACGQLTGIEGDEKMVARAYHNAEHNQLSNVAFYSANLDEDFSQHPWHKEKYHKILLDPPRSGAEKALQQVLPLKPERIVYVSCNPATLARDSKIITQHGYKFQTVGAMDMFPHTKHIEAIALFLRKK